MRGRGGDGKETNLLELNEEEEVVSEERVACTQKPTEKCITNNLVD